MQFLQKRPIAGMKEYYNKRCLLGMDIDAGPIIMNLSPTGTAFAIGPVTFFHDDEIRTRFLKTAELAGSTVTWKDRRHYMLADIALVGEAITLAMRRSLFGLICDNNFYIKVTEPGKALLKEVILRPPYNGAKDYFYISDVDDREYLASLIKATIPALPKPKVKKNLMR